MSRSKFDALSKLQNDYIAQQEMVPSTGGFIGPNQTLDADTPHH
ncbi:MAG: hypothetical protein R3C68_16575 [Myxococcota bacterium]